VVPVGEDQKQHIELTRDIAERFNHLFGEVFVVPRASIPAAGARVMGFDDPEAKMSKSLAEERPHHAVALLDTPKKIRKTIMRAVTDSGSEFQLDQMSLGLVNLLTVLRAITGESIESIAARFEGRGYGYLKQEVVDAVVAELEPVQSEYRRLMDDSGYLDGILAQSTEKVTAVANATMDRVRGAVGVG
jgi:tryptophanyl-tRNA synthetase